MPHSIESISSVSILDKAQNRVGGRKKVRREEEEEGGVREERGGKVEKTKWQVPSQIQIQFQMQNHSTARLAFCI